MPLFRLLLCLALLGLVPVVPVRAADTGVAGENLGTLSTSPASAESPAPAKRRSHGDLTEEFELSGLHAFSSSVKHGDTGFGDVSETSSHLKYVAVPKLADGLFLRVGVEWDRFDFGTSGLRPNYGVPSTLESEALVLGVDWKVAEQWLVRAEIAPGFYGTSENVGMDSASLPVTIGGVYLQSPDLQWMAGLEIDPRGQYPVMPGAGVRWRFADRWVLDAMLPKPQLEFEFDKRTTFYAGAALSSGTFRVNDGTGVGAGRPGLSAAIVSYTEVGVGAGVSWKFLPGFTLDGSAGYLVYRDFDYFNSKADFRADPAPYVSLNVTAKF